MKKTLQTAICVFILLTTINVWGQTTVTVGGGATITCPATPGPATWTTAPTGVTFSNWSRGSGVTCASASNGLSGSNFHSATAAAGYTANCYYSVTITADATHTFTLNSLAWMTVLSGSTNSCSFTVEYSNNGGAVTTFGTTGQTITSSGATNTFTYNGTVTVAAGTSLVLYLIPYNATATGTTARWINGSTITVTASAASTPNISASALSGFGNVCTSTTAGPNSFTITGTNLTAANVTIGALSGFKYSTDGITYSSSLSLSQAGGSYSQLVDVEFTPITATSYNGNIAVGGGGASSANVSATGSGVSLPTTTTSSASSITSSSATAGGSIANTSCGILSAYGIEYSTTNGFTPGTGTDVASSNLSSGNFTSGLTSLSQNTTYYYISYATNGSGTSYGTQSSFVTTGTPVITLTPSSPTLAFGNVVSGNTSGYLTYQVAGLSLTGNITVHLSGAGYTMCTTANGTYSTSDITLTQSGGTVSNTNIYVKFSPSGTGSFPATITNSGGGATTQNVTLSGAGIAAPTTFTSGNVVVLQVGDGTITGGTAVPIKLQEYDASGGGALFSASLNSATMTNSQSATSEGSLSLSSNGYYLSLGCYNAPSGTASIASSTSIAVPRLAVSVDNSANISSISANNFYSGNNIRGAATDGCGAFWGSGAADGIDYFAATGSTTINSGAPTNTRVTAIFNGQLYCSTGSGTAGIYSVGTGVPTTGGNVPVAVITNGSSPYGFAFSADGHTCYIADDGAGSGIQKWTYNTGMSSWGASPAYILTSGSSARGLTVDFSGANPVIYAVTGANTLIKIIDAGSGSTATVLATAATNYNFRGVAFAPKALPAAPLQASAVTFGSTTYQSTTASWTNGGGSSRLVFINTTNSFTAQQVSPEQLLQLIQVADNN